MKHFKQLTLIILTLSLLLCGCGGTQANGTNDNTGNNSTNTSTNNNSIVEKEEYSLSEYISSGETIWYLAEGYGKDDEIEQIYVLEPTGTVYYCDSKWTIGEAEQKDDNEIISYVKQTYEENMKETINYLINYQGKENKYTDEILVTDMSSIFTPYLEKIEPAHWKLSIITDSTGNNTQTEIFAYQDFAPLSLGDYCIAGVTYIELSYIVPYESDKGTTNCFQVYDSWYGGYRATGILSDSSETGNEVDGFLLTRVNTNLLFNLDEVGTKNIDIDNYPSFEENKIEVEWSMP